MYVCMTISNSIFFLLCLCWISAISGCPPICSIKILMVVPWLPQLSCICARGWIHVITTMQVWMVCNGCLQHLCSFLWLNTFGFFITMCCFLILVAPTRPVLQILQDPGVLWLTALLKWHASLSTVKVLCVLHRRYMFVPRRLQLCVLNTFRISMFCGVKKN